MCKGSSETLFAKGYHFYTPKAKPGRSSKGQFLAKGAAFLFFLNRRRGLLCFFTGRD
jgi:hypothetical protein